MLPITKQSQNVVCRALTLSQRRTFLLSAAQSAPSPSAQRISIVIDETASKATSSNASKRTQEKSSGSSSAEAEVDFADLAAEQAASDATFSAKVRQIFTSMLYGPEGEPPPPPPKIERITKTTDEKQPAKEPDPSSLPFRSHSNEVYKAAMTADKIARLMHEFPEEFGAKANSATYDLATPGTSSSSSQPSSTGPQIPEHKLRLFLLKEQQKERSDSSLNPTLISRTPVASRQFLSDNVPSTIAGSKAASARAKVAGKVRVQHALADAEAYKKPTEVLWQDYWNIRPAGSTGWQSLVEERIESARREGVFDNLPGKGERLYYMEDDPAHRNPFLDKGSYFINKAIRSQGLKPPFIEISQEIDGEITSLRRELKRIYAESLKSHSTRSYESQARALATQRISELNSRIRGYNITIPRGIPKKLIMDIDSELQRGKETESERKVRKQIEELKMDDLMKQFLDRM